MDNVLSSIRIPARAQWRELVLPKEHGSWSLALEPLIFGLIAAPSVAGGWLALAVTSGFFARRPLRIAWRDARAERRGEARIALATCVTAALVALSFAIAAAGVNWLTWLAPSAIAGALFVSFDLRNGGREELAELAGSAAFAFLPAAIAVLAGTRPESALALAVVMCGRAIPTVLCVRAALRAMKTGVRRPAPALVTAFVALVASLVLARNGLAPAAAVAALAVLALRATGLLVFPRPALRARTIGMIEAVLGLAFVLTAAVAWRA
jgi:hypothetical protein